MVTATILVVAATMFFALFVRAKDIPRPDPVSPTQHLEERKAAIYENLRDLQFEYRVGKLSDADYQATKLALQKELAGVLAEMEATTAKLGIVGARAAKPASVTAPAAPAAGLKCPHCGATFEKPLKFCGECGKAMA